MSKYSAWARPLVQWVGLPMILLLAFFFACTLLEGLCFDRWALFTRAFPGALVGTAIGAGLGSWIRPLFRRRAT